MASEAQRKAKKSYSDKATRTRREAKDVPCADCGVEYPFYVMQFDHVRGVKLFNIGSGTGNRNAKMLRHHGLKVLLDEIEKCDIVCANCHRIRTFKRKPL